MIAPFYRYLLDYRRSEDGNRDLNSAALVFAPHQDDEILGCGGTIIQKREAGARLRIVFMTDGSTSHAHLLPAARLKELRETEARAAACALGLEESDIVFLRYKDGQLDKYSDDATQKIVKLIQEYQPEQIFVPYHREAPADHRVTTSVALEAIRRCQHPVVVYEYPVWAWYHWPWVTAIPKIRREMYLKDSLLLGFGLRVLRDFRCAVNVKDVLPQKRAALAHYRSQMTRLVSDEQWLTLADVANGEFLKCFFSGVEHFHRYELAG